MVYDKNNQHTTLNGRYNAELAATFVGSIKLENADNNNSNSNEIKFDLTNENDNYLLYRQFVVWYCKGFSVASLTEYTNNEVYPELPRLDNIYDKKESNQCIYIDLRGGQGYTGELEKDNRNDSNLTLMVTFKTATAKKMRLRVIGYYQGEYLYTLSKQGILLTFKYYSIVEQNEIVRLAS